MITDDVREYLTAIRTSWVINTRTKAGLDHEQYQLWLLSLKEVTP